MPLCGPAVAQAALARRLARAHETGEIDCADAELAAGQCFAMLIKLPLMEALLGVRSRLEGPALEAHVHTCVGAFLSVHAIAIGAAAS